MPETEASVTLVWHTSNTLVLAPAAFGIATRRVSESNLHACIALTHLCANRSDLLFCDCARHSCCNLGPRHDQVFVFLSHFKAWVYGDVPLSARRRLPHWS